MTDIMKLIARLREPECENHDVGATGVSVELLDWDVLDEAADAIEALQAENERLTKELDAAQEEINCAESALEAFSCEFEAEVFNQGFDCLGDFVQALWKASNGQRDQLQAKLDAAHAVLDSDDSKIVLNAADGYPEGREPRELALSERVKALCTYATDWKRWCKEAQAKLDELQRQEPVAKFIASQESLTPEMQKVLNSMPYTSTEAPKALTEDVSYVMTVMALIEDYAKAVHDGDDNSCTVLRRTIKASLEQPPKALEPEPLIKFRHGCKWCGKAKCAADCYGITKGTPT